MEPTIELAINHGMPAHELREAQSLIEEHADEIRNAWQHHFGR